jgi:hypothetical protein
MWTHQLQFRAQSFKPFEEPRNLFQGINAASLCSLAGRYDNPIPSQFLAPIEYLKIPLQVKSLYLSNNYLERKAYLRSSCSTKERYAEPE